MYTLRQVKQGIEDPRLVVFEIYKLINAQKSTKVTERDWDNLLILDACRYDIFKKLNTIDGNLQSIRSMGSTTGEFLNANFASDIFPDIVYVSANPHLQSEDISHRFHDSVPVWETDWDEDLRTVPPDRMVERSIEAERKYPNKRLIIHFVQPHYPFIGETGRTIRHGEMTGNGIIKDERSYASIWDRLRNDEVDEDQVWQAYRENLELTLPHVQKLVDELTGKSVLTSDHGNALGEWGLYGHPGGRHIPSLVKVPWLPIEKDKRKKITEGNVSNERTGVSGEIDNRLRALGYK